MPNEHGPRFKLMSENELFDKIVESAPKKVVVQIVPATTSDKADCVCGSGKCKCEDNKVAYAKAVAAKQKKASATKPAAKPVAKKPVAKTTAKKDAIKKDIADTPVAKKPVAKKPTPKKK